MKPKGVSRETVKLVQSVLNGNANVHFYDPNLKFLADQKQAKQQQLQAQYKTV